MITTCEIFGPTISGEGSSMGKLQVFLRTANCNFRCTGFKVPVEKDGVLVKDDNGEQLYGCDSYNSTYSKHFKDEWKQYVDFKELVNDIDKFFPKYSSHNYTKVGLCVTGGEPLVFWNDNEYQRVLSHYISRDVPITIETNASLDIDFTRKYQEDITFSMSVKLSNSGEPASKRINIDTITKMIEYGKDSYLKFVVSKEGFDEQWKEIKEILNAIPVYAPCYLMPMGMNQEELQENAKFVAEKCLEHGMLYSDRLHIRLWDDLKLV